MLASTETLACLKKLQATSPLPEPPRQENSKNPSQAPLDPPMPKALSPALPSGPEVERFRQEVSQVRAQLANGQSSVHVAETGAASLRSYLQAEEKAWVVFQDSELSYNLPTRPQLDLLEVYAGSDSRLTTAVRDAGGRAERFTIADGDLTTPEAQRKLGRMLQQYQPKHIWVAPECRLWSSWTFLNQSRSPAHLEKYKAARLQEAAHLRVCARLFEWQATRGRHFHLEQPAASQMLQEAILQPIVSGCSRVQVDMCQFGLRAPISKKLIRKRTCILTTCPNLLQTLQSKHCDQSHNHQTIEGTTSVGGQRMNLSKFAASYCFGFARCVAQTILRQDNPQQALPAQTETGAESTPLTRKRFKTNGGWSVPPVPLNLNKRLAPGTAEQRTAQRSRTDPGQPVPPGPAEQPAPMVHLPHEVWAPVFEAARETAPRRDNQGSSLVPTEHQLCKLVQDALPNTEVCQIFVGRQLRTLQMPLGALPSSDAPTRITIAMLVGPQRFIRVARDVREQMPSTQKRARIPEAELLLTIFTRVPPSPEGNPGQSPSVQDLSLIHI